MIDDPHTAALWEQAKGLTGNVTGDAVRAAGFRSVLDLDHAPSAVKATIAAAGIQACGTIFAALVEADMLRQLREAREAQEDQHNDR